MTQPQTPKVPRPSLKSNAQHNTPLTVSPDMIRGPLAYAARPACEGQNAPATNSLSPPRTSHTGSRPRITSGETECDRALS